MAQQVHYYDMLQVLKRAYAVGIDCDRAGFTFRCGETSDDHSSDGGMPSTGWYHWAVAFAGGEKVLDDKTYVEGPWMDDLPGILNAIDLETRAAIEAREIAAAEAKAAAERAEQEAKDAARQKQIDTYLAQKEQA